MVGGLPCPHPYTSSEFGCPSLCRQDIASLGLPCDRTAQNTSMDGFPKKERTPVGLGLWASSTVACPRGRMATWSSSRRPTPPRCCGSPQLSRSDGPGRRVRLGVEARRSRRRLVGGRSFVRSPEKHPRLLGSWLSVPGWPDLSLSRFFGRQNQGISQYLASRFVLSNGSHS